MYVCLYLHLGKTFYCETFNICDHGYAYSTFGPIDITYGRTKEVVAPYHWIDAWPLWTDLSCAPGMPRYLTPDNSPHVLLYTGKFVQTKCINQSIANCGLLFFYCANIRSALCYGAIMYYQFLSELGKTKLKKVQKAATKIILPNMNYSERLQELNLSTLDKHIMTQSIAQFDKVALDQTHPLHKRVCHNNARRSARNSSLYRPKQPRTTKRMNSFFYEFF